MLKRSEKEMKKVAFVVFASGSFFGGTKFQRDPNADVYNDDPVVLDGVDRRHVRTSSVVVRGTIHNKN